MHPHASATLDPPEPEVVSQATRWPLLTMGAVVVLALALVVGFTLGLRGGETYPADSPEAALQRYLVAAIDGDRPAAEALLSDEALCDTPFGEAWPSSDVDFRLEALTVEGVDATARVSMRHLTDPFEPARSETRLTFTLTRIDGDWRVSDAPWPWWIETCRGRP